jgi:hypothetical protein
MLSRVEWIEQGTTPGDLVKIVTDSNSYVFHRCQEVPQEISQYHQEAGSSPLYNTEGNNPVIFSPLVGLILTEADFHAQYVGIDLLKKTLFGEPVKGYEVLESGDSEGVLTAIKKKLALKKPATFAENVNESDLVRFLTENDQAVHLFYWGENPHQLPLSQEDLVLSGIEREDLDLGNTLFFSSLYPGHGFSSGDSLVQYTGIDKIKFRLFNEEIKGYEVVQNSANSAMSEPMISER